MFGIYLFKSHLRFFSFIIIVHLMNLNYKYSKIININLNLDLMNFITKFLTIFLKQII